MKKRLSLVLAAVFSLTCFTFCYADGLFDNTVAKQSFQQAGTRTPSTKKADSSSNEMAAVEAVMAKSKAIQVQQQNNANQADNVTSSLSTAPTSAISAPPVLADNSNSGLQAQISTLNQENLLFQQSANQRIEFLTQNNNTLFAKVKLLSQTLVMLNQQIDQITNALQAAQQEIQQGLPFHLNNQLGHYDNYVVYGCFILLLSILMVMLLLLRHRRQQALAGNAGLSNDDDDTKSEYDFMNASEAIPAKLDLAHAYIAMDDLVSAKKELQHILKAGNAQQQKLAQDMMKQINQQEEGKNKK